MTLIKRPLAKFKYFLLRTLSDIFIYRLESDFQMEQQEDSPSFSLETGFEKYNLMIIFLIEFFNLIF